MYDPEEGRPCFLKYWYKKYNIPDCKISLASFVLHVTSPTPGPPPLCKQVLRAYLHGGGRPQVGEVTHLGGATRLSI